MGEIHELFVLALSLVWFAGATPEIMLFSYVRIWAPMVKLRRGGLTLRGLLQST